MSRMSGVCARSQALFANGFAFFPNAPDLFTEDAELSDGRGYDGVSGGGGIQISNSS